MIGVRTRSAAKRGAAAVVSVLLMSALAWGDTSNLVIGARAQGMGSAFVAVADDASAAYWNPAGLTRIEASELSYSYWTLSDVSDVGVNFAAFAMPLSRGAWNTALGFSVVRVGAELEQGPDAQRSDISDSRYSLSLGLGLSEIFSLGVTMSRLQVNSEIESGSGVGFEAGLLAKPLSEQPLYLAVTGRNLSAELKNEDLEESWRFGAAWTVWEDRITIAGDALLREDINKNEGKSGLWYGGVEVAPVPQLALRGGGGSRKQWGFGFGVNHRNVHLDYALAGDDDALGTSHRFTLSYLFGQGARSNRNDAPES